MQMSGCCWKVSANPSKIKQMITHCKECDTYFRVSIEQLKAANGQVKCGCCMTVFNAIESLLESTEIPTHHVSPAAREDEGEAIGSALLGKEEPDETIVATNETKDTSHYSWNDIDFDPNPLDDEPTDTEPEKENKDNLNEEHQDTQATDLPETEGFHETAFEDHPLPVDEELHENRSSPIWASTSLVLLGLLAFQIVKFNPELILSRFPGLQPLCDYIDCPVTEVPSDVSSINLISRDVREHPQFKGVLLVNATLVNNSDKPVPFPKLQLNLFDKVGRLVGSRKFTPDEYLDSSVDQEAGMRPEIPVHVVLEVVDSGEETQSFEFRFL